MLCQLGISDILLAIIIGSHVVKKKGSLNKRQWQLLIGLVVLITVVNSVYIWVVLPSKSLFNYLITDIVLGLLGVGVVFLISQVDELVIDHKSRLGKQIAFLIISFVLLIGASVGYDIYNYSKKNMMDSEGLINLVDLVFLKKTGRKYAIALQYRWLANVGRFNVR